MSKRLLGNIRPGQAALIVILVVIVGATVAIAILSRSVTTVQISTAEEERARAFSAAEAGIEDALRQDLSGLAGPQPTFAVGESNVSYQVVRRSDITAEVNPGQTVTIDWSKGDPTATLATVTWDSAACGGTSLVSTVITSSGDVTHDVSSSGSEPFGAVSNGLVRLRFVHSEADCSNSVRILGDRELSFFQVESTGTSGEATSKVQVIRSEPAAIGLMDFAVFSGSGIQ